MDESSSYHQVGALARELSVSSRFQSASGTAHTKTTSYRIRDAASLHGCAKTVGASRSYRNVCI